MAAVVLLNEHAADRPDVAAAPGAQAPGAAGAQPAGNLIDKIKERLQQITESWRRRRSEQPTASVRDRLLDVYYAAPWEWRHRLRVARTQLRHFRRNHELHQFLSRLDRLSDRELRLLNLDRATMASVIEDRQIAVDFGLQSRRLRRPELLAA